MQIEVSFKQMEHSDPLRAYVEEKLDKILKSLPEPVSAQVVLQVEKYRHIAKITLTTNGIVIKGKEETNDMYSSIDLVLDKLGRQIKKYREKLDRRGDRETLREFRAELSVLGSVQSGAQEHPVVRSKEIILKPMTVEEALMQMELMDKNFLLFNNARTQTINVIYLRDDGNFGLIEPRLED